MRPLLLVGLQTDYGARDFLDSGVLDALARDFELAFVVSERLGADLSRLGRVAASHQVEGLRLKLWTVAFSLRHLAGLDPVVRMQKNRLAMFLRGRGRKTKLLVLLLHRLGLSGILSAILERVLARLTPEFLDLPRRPAAALLPSGINDPFWDDLVTWCRRRGVPSLTVTVNWDNIAHKVFLQPPDRLGVWGEQGHLFARLLQKLPAERIEMLGTPRFEPYREVRVSKEEARERLGLPAQGTLVLFAGAGVAFDEVSLLEDFEAACARGDIPEDLTLLYKPHPKRHPRAAEPPLRPESYQRVRVLAKELTPLGQYPALLAAVDGLVTPLSTMMLEGALLGLPAVGLAYDDPRHGDFSWSNARLQNHLHPIASGRWHVACHAREDFVPALKRLLSLVGDEEVARAARGTASFIVYDDGRSYAERLAETLKRLAGLPGADGRLPASPQAMTAKAAEAP